MRQRVPLARDQRGLVLLLGVLSFMGLFAFLAIVGDAGLAFRERREELQNAADAAAPAGVQDPERSGCR